MASVLVVDDHPDLRLMLEVSLRHAGHFVFLAGNGREALDLFRRHRPEVSIVDIFMPEMDGIETIMTMRGEAPAAKIIAISAGWKSRDPDWPSDRDPFSVLSHAELLGADLAMPKPLDPFAVVAAVERLAGASGVSPERG